MIDDRDDLGRGHRTVDPQGLYAPADLLGGSHRESDRQSPSAAADLLDPGQDMLDTQNGDAGVDPFPGGSHSGGAAQRRIAAASDLLLIWADALDDLEAQRIATDNRIRALTTPVEDGGKGFDKASPEVGRFLVIADGIAAMEHQTVLGLQAALKTHPLGPWIKATVGIGPKQGARLLAAIGDPYWHTRDDRPRLASELWSYCGYSVTRLGHSGPDHQSRVAEAGQSDDLGHSGSDHQRIAAEADSDPGHEMVAAHRAYAGVARRRQKGQRANWNATAKMRAFLVAESCIKQTHSPYRAVYEDGRTKYADATHPAPCARCGPAGKPAAAGSPLSLGHQHARALRLVAKEVLRDLWREAKRIHEAGS